MLRAVPDPPDDGLPSEEESGSPGALEVARGCVQLVGLLVRLVFWLALLVMILWFVVTVITS